MFDNLNLTTIALSVLPIIVAITLHEAAHAWSALKLGDDTAYRLGRVTVNPLPHIDPVGTLLVPFMLIITGAPFLFGWAKPVPVMFGRLGTQLISMRYSVVLVALAGPAANIVIALAAALLSHAVGLVPDFAVPWTQRLLINFIIFNVFLAVFNLIPIPPLDGGRIAVGLLPGQLAWPLARLEPFGFFILIGLLIVLPMFGDSLGMQLDFLSQALRWVFSLVLKPFIAISGFG